MRWDRFFEDLEDQVASEWEAERAALDTEAERLRLSRVVLRDRLRSLADGAAVDVSVELVEGTVVSGRVSAVGADWVALPMTGRPGALILPLRSVLSVGLAHADALRSARPAERTSATADRMTFGFVARDLSRRRLPVSMHLVTGRRLDGTIDRAGADHLDLALHDVGAPRRSTEVTGYRLVPFDAVAWLRVDSAASVF